MILVRVAVVKYTRNAAWQKLRKFNKVSIMKTNFLMKKHLLAVFVVTLCSLILTDGLSAQNGVFSARGASQKSPELSRQIAATNSTEEISATNESASGDSIFGSKSLLEIIRNGGPLMIPIGICSIVLLVFVFERFISLRKGRIIPRPFVKRFLKQLEEGQLDQESALERCIENPSPVSEVFAAAVTKWGRPSVEVEQSILDSGERVTTSLRRYLRLINGIATVCPLLGLLGTVVGMIQAFDAIGSVAASSTDPKVLIATGISQALLTTAAGMSVAIPALIAYLFFVGRVDRLVVEIDALGQKVVNLIASDAVRMAGRNKTSKSKRTRKTQSAAA